MLPKKALEPFNGQCSYHVETSQLICSANQMTGFYMMGTLVVKGLKSTESEEKDDSDVDFFFIVSFSI